MRFPGAEDSRVSTSTAKAWHGCGMRTRTPARNGPYVRHSWRLLRAIDPHRLLGTLECVYANARVGGFTMVLPAGLADLWWLTRHIENRHLVGALVQCLARRSAAVTARVDRLLVGEAR